MVENKVGFQNPRDLLRSDGSKIASVSFQAPLKARSGVCVEYSETSQPLLLLSFLVSEMLNPTEGPYATLGEPSGLTIEMISPEEIKKRARASSSSLSGLSRSISLPAASVGIPLLNDR